MKKFKNLLMFVSSTLLLFGGLVSCGQNKTDPILPPFPPAPPVVQKFDLDLTDYQMNISDATSIGISRTNNLKKSRILKAEGDPTPTENTNTLFKTTVDYKDGTSIPELDENKNLVGVTFTKILTTETTKTTTGSKDYLSFGATKVAEDKEEYNKDAKIQIAVPKFQKRTENGKPVGDEEFVNYTYSLYDGETLLLDNIKDNDINDSNETVGLIELGNLENNKTYTVKYSGQVEQIDVTQSEIGAEIDKVYVYSPEITIMSFVPEGTSQRPLDSELEMTPDGQSEYDSCDYYSKNTIDNPKPERQARQSFVCDNTTGNIYKLGNDANGNPVEILEIKYGIIYLNANEFPYILDIINNDLYFRPLHTNPDIHMISCFRDKFGNNYILNEELNEYNAETKTYFYTPRYLEYDFSHNIVNPVPKDAYMYYLTTSRDAIRVPCELFLKNNGLTNGLTKDLILDSGKTIDVQTKTGFRKLEAFDEFKIINDSCNTFGLQLLGIKDYSLNVMVSEVFTSKRFILYTYGNMFTDYISYKLTLDPETNTFKVYTNLRGDYSYFNAKYINYDVMFKFDEKSGTVYYYKDWYKNNFTSAPIVAQTGLKIQGCTLKKISSTGSEIYDVYLIEDEDTKELDIGCVPVIGNTFPAGEDLTYKFTPINR